MSMVGMEADRVLVVVQEEGLQCMQTRTLTGERTSHLAEALFLAARSFHYDLQKHRQEIFLSEKEKG